MKIRAFFTKKKIIWMAIIVVIISGIVYQIVKPNNDASKILTDTVKKQDLKQTVLATGEVTSSTDLNLSFKISGIVRKIFVKVGDKAKMGDILATLDQGDQLASLTSARGTLASAQASLDKIIAGSTSEEIRVYQTALDNAIKSLDETKKQQAVLVSNAKSAYLNSSISAQASSGILSTVTVTVTGTYTSYEEGSYIVRAYQTSDGPRFSASGLENADGIIKSTTSASLGTRGLYIVFSSTAVFSGDVWIIDIPNKKSSSYITYFNAYQSALETQRVAISTAQSAVNTAQAQLDLKKAQARPVDLDAANAAVLSAQGQVQAAQASFENTILRAPANGTITSVDIKVGELATGLKEAIILQDVDNLHLEANVSESNVADIKTGQTVDVTFDALSPDKHIPAVVQLIDPASTVISGVVNYKITASMDKIAEIRPGMTSNMTIMTNSKIDALAVPQRAIIQNGTKKVVRLITNSAKKTYSEVEIISGITADGGLVEVLSGLEEGQEIVTFINK